MASSKVAKQRGPKILLLDIEITHNIVATFDLFDKHNKGIPFDNILQERYIVCAAWKWLGERAVHTAQVDERNNDSGVVRELAAALDEADIVVTHNGDRFDLKYIRTRALKLKLGRIITPFSIDTLKIAKQYFAFNSNRLDYLGEYLGVGRKKKVGGAVWLRALKGDRKAISKLVRYNAGDVRLLEAVFLKLRPYARQFPVFGQPGQYTCPTCFSTRTKSKGRHYTATRSYQRRVCLKCGSPFQARIVTSKAEIR